MIDLACKTIVQSISLMRRAYGRICRRAILAQLAEVGTNFRFDALTSTFVTPDSIHVGSNVFFNLGAYLSGDIRIGNNVMFGPHVTLLSGNHLFALRGKSVRHLRFREENPEYLGISTIEDEVWIGANVTILGDLTVGIGAVVGAGFVVTRDVPPFTIAVGNPCRPVRLVFDDQSLSEHLRSLGYESGFATEVVARRRAALGSMSLPVVDNTDRFHNCLYHGELLGSPGGQS